MRDIWVPLSGALAQQRKIDTIANNVANINTPGFKRDSLVFKEYLTAIEKAQEGAEELPQKEWQPTDYYRSYGAENAHVKVDGTYTQFSQGDLSPTNNPLDLAINGQGFFEILTPSGIRYTRKGIFSISQDGTLVSDQGFPVLSKSSSVNADATGRTIRLNRLEGVINVNLNGEIFVNNNKVSDLSLVEFKDPRFLMKEGNSLYINRDLDNLKNGPKTSEIRQGFVEESNINAMSEMANLIESHRLFENIQRVIKTYDQLSGRNVNEISKF